MLRTELGKDIMIEQLKNDYDAIFLAIGANKPCKMNIEGEDLEGVYGGNYLLESSNHPNYKGKNVAIIGGGNVAIDCARTVKRLGAKNVFVIYRRAEEQMLAEKKEIEDAKKENVEFLFQNNLVRIVPDSEKKKIKEIECIKTELVKKENEDRLVPVNIENSNYYIDINYVVMAIGSMPERNVTDNLGLELTKKGYIKVNDKYQTSDSKIFAGGDITQTEQTVAWAAKTGRDAAKNIIQFLNN